MSELQIFNDPRPCRCPPAAHSRSELHPIGIEPNLKPRILAPQPTHPRSLCIDSEKTGPQGRCDVERGAGIP
jgi:hypothetical protein